MAIDTKTAAIGILLIGVVAMAGWVGFLYATPITKTKTKKDTDTEYITRYIEEDIDTKDGIPIDQSDAHTDAFISVYNETGGEIKVYLSDILNGIDLYWEQEEDPEGRKLHSYKPEYMALDSVVDPITGITFTGVDILDVLEFAGVFYAWNISCKSKSDLSNLYFNASTGDILDEWDSDHPTIIAIAANGRWLQDAGFGNFSLLQAESEDSVYDLVEVETLSEWEIKIYVNDTLQDFRINRTTVVDPNYPDGWHYEYHKEIESLGGKYNYNRTYWGINMSYALNQTDAYGYNYTMFAVSNDGPSPLTYNNTEVDLSLTYPDSYGIINSSMGGVPLPQTDHLITIVYQELRFREYGMFATDPWPWDKPYKKGYGSGPFQMLIPGQTKNKYAGAVTEIKITIYSGPIL